MLKITALNEVQSKENEEDNVNAITKEAQEQFALNEYNRALQLLIEGNKNEALNVFLDLLDTKLLDEVKKPPKQDGHARPMLSLKYACYKNIANIQADLGNYHEAVDNYWQAINLDDTDVMIWYKIGTLAVNKFDLEEASFAFRQGLKCNQNHWPCLDRLITVLFAIPDYMNCLMFISLALEKDPSYTKGLVFYKEILDKVPSFSTLASDYFEFPVDSKYDEKIGKALLDETAKLSEKWISLCKTDKSSLSHLNLEKPLESLSWVELGEKMVCMIKYMKDNDMNLLSCIVLADSEQLETLVSTFCSGKEIENHNDVPQQQDNGFADEKQIFSASENNGLENGNQSCSNECSITEKMMCTDDSPMDSCDESQIKIETNGCAEKLNSEDKDEENVANEDCKLNEKVSDYSLDNGNANASLNAREIQRQKKVKKRRRSSLCILQEWHWSSSNTKRSSRISNRKDCEKDGVEETLKRMFPPALLPDNIKFSKEDVLKNNDSMDTMDAYYAMLNKENNSTEDSKSTASFKANSPSNEGQVTYFGLEQEFLDVRDFINKHSGKSNMITLITKFVEFLCTKWNQKWPNALSELYIQLYLYVKKYTPQSSPFEYKTDDYLLKLTAAVKLLYCELLLDKWLFKRASTSGQSEKSGVALMSEDLGYVIFSSTDDNLSDAYLLRRVLWLKANLFLYQGDVEVALKIFELLLCHIQESQTDSQVKLDNCRYNATISVDAVRKTITLIKRSKKFSKIRQLYEDKNHEEVSGILKDTFYVTKQINEFLVHTDKPIDRIDHFKLLLDSLWQLRQFEDCYVWAEACFNESWHNYLNTIGIDTQSCDNDGEKKKWVDSILYTLKMLDDCVSEVSTFVVQYLQESRRSRLVKNLVHFVSHQLEVLESTQSIPIFSALPWILLHYILQYEEDRGRARSISRQKRTSDVSLNSEPDDNEGEIPASMILLFKAHTFLGRHGWCCIDEGRLLLFIVKSIIPKLNFPLYAKIKAKLKEPLEQVVFCLYGHPLKASAGMKQRPKYLEDHITQHMPLTWEMCQILLEFYRPETLPSYDAKKIDSISADTLDLFKKLVTHVPKDSDSSLEPATEMYAYLRGNRTNIPQVKVPLSGQSSYIYYFIADYYFKNLGKQSWLKASKYYVFDLCQHSDEFNSWAGLAMSTSTLMETWLNNFEPNISEEKYLDKALVAQKSYQHAVDLEPSHLTIWTEYGNFLYTVHSFCSRLLKQESDSLNMQRFEVLENQKDEMLNKAKHCFTSADNIFNSCQGVDEPQDERWLYQYMLGKVAEKKNEEPPIFLKHYLQAGDRLFQNNAQYPKRVNHSNPPHLSIEALEVYYRIYASILKYLEQHEGKPLKKSLAMMLNESLKKCLKLPFVSYDCTFYKVPTEQLVPSTKVRSQDQQQWASKKSSSAGAKRRNDESMSGDDRAKVARYSESDLRKDVGSLVNDLIMEVCNRLSPEKEIAEQCAVIKFASSANASVSMEVDEPQVPKVEETDDASKRMGEVKKCNSKSDKLLNRRDSQESSTTTQTSTSETNNTSSDSSSSSSSDDSSDSSSSSDSDSESASSDTEKKTQPAANENALATDREVNELIEMCLAGLEQCILRFPEHYKSVYRLAYFYFNNRTFKNVAACKQLLLASYPCRFHPNQKIQGLFGDRKPSNFFNGIWRIPVQEIDRPGSFASHMSRCVSFLMQVLKSSGDSRMLTELCVQLHKVPDADKKYLRDNEREQLACQALTLCIQCLRVKIKSNCNDTTLTYEANVEAKLQVLLDIYHTYHTIQKHVAEQESAAMPQLKKLMEEGYIAYSGHPNLAGNVFEIAKNCCKQHLKPKNKPNNIPNISPTITPSTSSLTIAPVPKMPGTAPRKSQKNQGPPKPRGRPPGDKLSNPSRTNFKSTLNDIPTSQANASLYAGNPAMNPFFQQALLRPEFLAAMFSSSISSSAIDSAMQYLNSLNAAPGLNLNYNNPATKPFNNPAPTATTTTSEKPSNMFGSIKARPDVSITPVLKSPHPKSSQSKVKRSNEGASTSRSTKQTMNAMSAPEISLLKQPSQAHQRVPDHGMLNQAALNLLDSTATSRSSTIFPPTSQTSITPVQSLPKIPRVSQMNPPMQHLTQASITPVKTSQPSTSLQHKLLSSKHPQPYHSSVITSAPARKEEPVKPYYSKPRQSPNDMSMLSGLPSSISVNPLQSEILKSLNAPMPYSMKKSAPKAPKKSSASYSMKNLTQDIGNPAGFSHKKDVNLSTGYNPMKYPAQDLSHSPVFSHKKFAQDSVNITQAYSMKNPDINKHSVKKSMQDLHLPSAYPTKKKIPEAHSSSGYSMKKSVQDVNNLPGMSLKKSAQDINNLAGMSLKKPAQEVNNPAAYSVLNRLQQHSHLEIIPQANRSRQVEQQMNPPLEFSPVNSAPKPMSFMNSDSVTMYELPKQKPSTSNNSTATQRAEKPSSTSTQQNEVVGGKVEIITLDD